MSNLPSGKPYARLSDFALDPTSVYDSYDEAADYASTSPIAYVGQVLGVREGATCNVYVIEPDRTLKRVGDTVDSPVLGYQAFEIGSVLWQDADLDIPLGWLATEDVFDASEYPALHALYGTNVVPAYPIIEGKKAIVLGRYVDRIRIPVEGFVEPAGLNQSMQEQLIAAVNTLIAQMTFEDDERKRILATISASTLSSDDLPTLHARIRHCSARLSQILLNKGIHEPADSPLETLIDRIEADEQPVPYSDMIAELVERMGRELFQELAKPYMNNGKNKPNKNWTSVIGNILMALRDEEE